MYEKTLQKIKECERCKPNFCCCSIVWPTGPTGSACGPIGPTGATGPQGVAGGVLNFADFYALMPPDNAATVAPGTDVSFPQDGPNSGSDIARIGADSFNLAQIDTYQVLFQVSVTEAGQLELTLNGATSIHCSRKSNGD